MQLNRDGVSLYYEEAGSGSPPLVFVHGYACDHSHFQPQMERFGRDHRVVAVDLRGFGGSDKPQQEYSFQGFADDLAWLCKELGIEKPVFVGHSMGGVIALELAARYPELPAAIVMLDSPILIPESTLPMLAPVSEGIFGPNCHAAIRDFFDIFFAPADDQQRKQRILDGTQKVPVHVLQSAWRSLTTWDAATAAAGCKVPALFISAGSPNCDLPRFRELCPQLIDGKTVGSGHFHQLEVPEQINGMIARFLATAVPQPATAGA